MGCSVPPWLPLNHGTEDTVDTVVDTEFTVDTVMVDTVARDLLMLNLMPKLGEPLVTDTVPDMVLVDMEVTVKALPAMGVTVLDTVSGRDPLMPKLGVPLDMDAVLDMFLVDMEVTVLD